MTDTPLDPPVEDVLEILLTTYGEPDVDDEPDDILATLVSSILSQATSGHNAAQAFGTLLDTYEGDWARIAHAPVGAIADAISVGGLSKQKAPRIQSILKQTHEIYGEYTLEPLHDLVPERAHELLLAMPGVGPKTASFVLMRAARMPFFAINTHILRLCARLGWTQSSWSNAKAHKAMLRHIPEGQHDRAHVMLIEHGTTTCHKNKPQCTTCALEHLCAHQRHT